MAYGCEISPNQQIYLDSQGNNTVVTLTTGGPGQQQQASNSFQTGSWISPPEMFATPQGAVVKVTTAQGEYYIQLQGGSMSLTNAGVMAASQQIPLHQTDSPAAPAMAPTMQPMKPMQPMQPMKMGNMEMNLNPMEMRMGNMQMRMGEIGQPEAAPAVQITPAPLTPATAGPAATRNFCSQCGAAVTASDRFCASCGHRLV